MSTRERHALVRSVVRAATATLFVMLMIAAMGVVGGIESGQFP